MRPHSISLQNLNVAAVSGQVDNGGGHLVWYAMRETSGTAVASFRLWDGTSNGGRLLLPVNLNPNGSVREWPGAHTLAYETGLYLEVLAGTFEGTVQVIPKDEWDQHQADVLAIIGQLTINA